MTRSFVLRSSVLAGLTWIGSAVLLLPPPEAGENVKLNDDFPFVPSGQIREWLVSPDGTRAVYVADQDHPRQYEIYSVPLDGSRPPIKLNPDYDFLSSGFETDVVGSQLSFGFLASFVISPDSTTVVYRADQNRNNAYELYSVPIDGGATTRLVGPLQIWEDVYEFKISANGWVVFSTDKTEDQRLELYSVPLQGGTNPVRLDRALVTPAELKSFEPTPDGARVLYVSRPGGTQLDELHTVPTDRSLGPRLLSPAPTNPYVEVFGLVFSPDSQTVVFLADVLTNTEYEIYAAPVDASAAAQRLNDAPTTYQDLVISPDGQRVAYRTGHLVFSTPLDASAAPTQLNPDYPGWSVSPEDLRATSVGNRLVYRAAQDQPVDELYSVPFDGSEQPVRLNGPLVAGGRVWDFALDADGARVVYRADQVTEDVLELYSVPVDGSASSIRISLPPIADRDVFAGFEITPDDQFVTYLSDWNAPGATHLFGVPTDGAQAAVPLVTNTDVDSYVLPADPTRVVYRADHGAEEIPSLFAVPVDASSGETRLTGDLAHSPVGTVTALRLTPDGRRTVYVARQEDPPGFEVYSSPTDGSAPPLRLTPPGISVGEFERILVDSTGTRAVYVAEQDAPGRPEIYSVPVDGSAPPTKLNPQPVFGGGVQRFGSGEYFLISPDGQRVVFAGDLVRNEHFELFSAPIDGSQAAVKLTPTPVANWDVVTRMEFSADGTFVAFHYQEVNFVTSLYSVRADGSAPMHRIAFPLSNRAPVFQTTPVGDDVVFRAELETAGMTELFVAPLDGSAPPTKLNGPLQPNGDVTESLFGATGFVISPDGGRVLYVADQEVDGLYELYSVPLTDGSAAVKLGSNVVSSSIGTPYSLTPDMATVVYVVGFTQLMQRPSDGSGIPNQLNTPGHSFASVYAFDITADGQHVVFFGDQETSNKDELYVVPLDGSSPPSKLNQNLIAVRDVLADFHLTSDGSSVLYRADPGINDKFKLWSVPTDLSSAPRQLNGRMIDAGDVHSFQVTDDLGCVVYLADQEFNSVDEAWASPLRTMVRSVSPARGPSTGGNSVLIKGQMFPSSPAVEFGGVPAPEVTRIDSRTLEVVAPRLRVPQAPVGPATGHARRAVLSETSVDVTVSGGGESTMLPGGYTYFPGSERRL